MKILHTSDWHIGKMLFNKKRYDEHIAFLNWLAKTIDAQKIDALIIAGDIFDTSAPSNYAQEIYYSFLCELTKISTCRHVIITAGNHDSPSLLDAPKDILKYLNIHVIGNPKENLEDEVFLLKDMSGNPELIVCAVPYLRDKDIRKSEAGEDTSDKETKIIAGIRTHYQDVYEVASAKQKEFGNNIPIIATGHLFATGSKTNESERDLYIGGIGNIDASIFPSNIDYVALGHIHIAQKIGGRDNLRYSGSPLPINFEEAKSDKKVICVEFNNKGQVITDIIVPSFQRLESITGDLDTVVSKLQSLKQEKSSIFCEVILEEANSVAYLSSIIEDSCVEILRIKVNNTSTVNQTSFSLNDNLETLTHFDIFDRCLDVKSVADEDRSSQNKLKNAKMGQIAFLNWLCRWLKIPAICSKHNL